MTAPTFYSHTDSGAPAVALNDPEFISKILNACLVTGYGSKTAAGWTKPYVGTTGTTESVADFTNVSNTGVVGPSAADYVIGTADFTIECKVYITANAANTYLWDLRGPSNSTYGLVHTDVSGNVLYYTNSGYRITAAAAITPNTWTHVALVRQSNVTKLFINGNTAGTAYTDSTNYSSAGRVVIGTPYSYNTGYNLKGYMEDFRMVIGTAVYTTNFTVPTTNLTAISNTKILLNFNGENRSTTFTDSSTVGATFTSPEVMLSNQIASPNSTLNPTTTQLNIYQNNTGRAITVEAVSQHYNYVQGYNTATALTAGSGPFIPAEASFRGIWNRGDPQNTLTANHEWYVAANDDFFYIALKIKYPATYNPTPGVVYSPNSYEHTDELFKVYAFGTMSDLKIPGVDSIIFYDTTSVAASQLNSTTSMHPYSRGAASGIAGASCNRLTPAIDAILSIGILKYAPFRSINGFFTGDNGSSETNKSDPQLQLKIRSKGRHLVGLSKIFIINYVQGGFSYVPVGTMPGMRTFLSPYNANVKMFDDISTKDLNNNTKQYKVLRGIAGVGFQFNSPVTYFLDKGVW